MKKLGYWKRLHTEVKHTTFDKLQKRLMDDLGLSAKDFRRTRCGKWERSSGAWSWDAVDASTGQRTVGSQYSATELLKSKKMSIYQDDTKYCFDTEIMPE